MCLKVPRGLEIGEFTSFMTWFSICKTHFQIPLENLLSRFSIQDGALGNKGVSGGKHFIFRPKVTRGSALPLVHMTAKINLPFCTRFCLHVSRDDRSVWYIQHDSTHQECSPKPRPPNDPSNFPISQSLEGRVLILSDFSHFLLHSICRMLGILGSSILAELSHTEDSSKTLPKEKNASVGPATQRPYCHTVVSSEVQRHLGWRGLKSIIDTCIHADRTRSQ